MVCEVCVRSFCFIVASNQDGKNEMGQICRSRNKFIFYELHLQRQMKNVKYYQTSKYEA